jgi:PAS domain S-box-containing protein
VTRDARRLRAAEDIYALLDAAVDLAIPELAEVAVLAVSDAAVDAGRTGLQLRVRHADPAERARIAPLLAVDLPSMLPAAGRVIHRASTRQGIWFASLQNALARRRLATPDLKQLGEMVDLLGLRAVIVVPVRAAGEIVGALGLGRTSPDAHYAAAEFAAAHSIAERIGDALQAIRLRQQLAAEDARRSRAEEALLKWTHAFEHAPYGAAIVDPSGRLESVNCAFARMHGYATIAELRGRRFSDLQGREGDHPAPLDGVRHGTTWEAIQRRLNGSTFPALLSDTPLRTPDGQLLYRAVTVQDLTVVRRTEEQLRHAQRLEALGRLAGGVAHEVNNMMMVVLGFADLLAQATELTEDHRGELGQITGAAERAAAISRQLLAYGRQQVLRPTAIDINQLVTRVVGLVRPLIAATVSIHTDLGDLAGNGVYADGGQIEQALLNLALNARDAMPHGGELRITTQVGRVAPELATYHLGFELPAQPYVLLTVADGGVGMDAETLAHAFDPFFTTKPMGKGTGLGLATVYGIVKQSGGYVWADSDPGRGTSVTICLPAVHLQRPSGQGEEPGLMPGGSARVLVVDDEPSIRQLSARMLERLGYAAEEAGEASEALERIETSTPDVVLVDVMMPGMSGRELRERVLAAWPDLPVVLMSGHPSAELLQAELKNGDNHWLAKPFTISTLAATLRDALAARVPGS